MEHGVSSTATSRSNRHPDASLPWWRNTLFVVGLTLIALGIGNWVTGAQRLGEQEALLARLGSDPGELEAREQALVARSRLDFYHVVESGGRLLVATGLLVSTAGALRWRRPRRRTGRGSGGGAAR